ncbi:hypothetical protein [Methylobacterium sp. Leaf86]|uniref:hypothetical protein n=1 Tax=Methylobacterium sp. Leaf86 TaxID=1736242 RepID=UPI0012E92B27|nr:hypothetical protein [Methylobacterium sp. Leaf86]
MHAMVSLALEGLHRISIDDDTDVHVSSWIAGLPTTLKEQWQEVLDQGYRLEALEPAKRSAVSADVNESNWDLEIPILTPTDAHQLMRKPFNALLENAFSDKFFLLRMANEEQRRFIERYEKVGALNFENGGGITEMPKRLDRAAAIGKSETIRLWVLFDSDALKPNEPSPHSSQLKAKCVELGVAHYQLKRRSIENYIPRRTLQAWAFNNPKLKGNRQPVYQAYMKLTSEQRSHYNLKEGFAGDMKRRPPADLSLFDSLCEADQRLLAGGFERSISDVFHSDLVHEEDLAVDGCWTEMNPVVVQLIALLR